MVAPFFSRHHFFTSADAALITKLIRFFLSRFQADGGKATAVHFHRHRVVFVDN